MHVRCPHCHNPIEVVEDSTLSDVSCPTCGSVFSLAGDLSPTLNRKGNQFSDGSALPSAAKKPKSFAHFEMIECVGVGAFGEVWRAKDTQLDRFVAVKIPRRGQLDSHEADLFLREARSAAQLKHPNIVSVYEVGREDGQIYIVSEFIQGRTLAERLLDSPLSVRESAALCITIADALHHAHEQGIVHRDLKPSNIMLDEKDVPYVTDFGLAKREAAEITMTVEGQILGTPAYMSPEQARGSAHDADARSDVYSLGVILFELLTGERPFRGNAQMLLQQVVQEEAPSPRSLNSNIARDLETICLKCLEKDAQRRYASAHALGDDLRHFLAGEPITARPVSRLERSWRYARRHPARTGLFSTSLIALLAIVGIVVGNTYQRKLESANVSLQSAKSQLEQALGTAKTDRERADQMARDAINKPIEIVKQQMLTVLRDVRIDGGKRDIKDFEALMQVSREIAASARDFNDQLLADLKDDPKMHTEVIRCHQNLGMASIILEKFNEAESSFDAAERLIQGLQKKDADILRFQLDGAKILVLLSAQYLRTQRSREAISVAHKAFKILERLVHQETVELEYRHQLALAHDDLAEVYRRARQMIEAEKAFVAAIEIQESVVQEQPTAGYVVDLGKMYQNWGFFEKDHGRSAEAEELDTKAIAAFRSALDAVPNNAEIQRRLLEGHRERAFNRLRLEHHAEAVADWDQVLLLMQTAVRAPGENLEFMARYLRAYSLVRSGNHVLASSEATALLEFDDVKNDVSFFFDLAALQARAAVTATEDETISSTKGKQFADTYAAKSLDCLQKAFTAGYFNNVAHVEKIKTNADFDLLRDREDFLMFLKQLM